MTTVNPRVNVTLKPYQYQLLTRLGRAQGRSRSAILLELLELVFPVLERVVVALEGAQRAEVMARDGLRESMERAEQAILPHVQAALGQLDLLVDQVVRPAAAASDYVQPDAPEAPSAAVGRRPRSSGPRHVTRGLGRGAVRPVDRSLDALASAVAGAVRRGPRRPRKAPRGHK